METTYRIVGSDGKEYGPVTLEQLQAWSKEGRVTPTTQVARSDVNAWLPASNYSELGLAGGAGGTAAASVVQAPPATGVPDELAEMHKRVRSGGSWFYWVAGLSLINSFAALSGSNWGFIFGLQITQEIDHFARETGGNAKAIAMVLDVLAAGVLVLFGVFACKRHVWAFITGMVLYGADALLTVFAQYWLGVAFHAWVLFTLFVGLKAALQINRATAGTRT
jgi:hypothetical protein